MQNQPPFQPIPDTTTPEAALAKDRLRDAATVILIRRDGPEPRLLMGQRGAQAAFMPSKFVFPGGAVDATDAGVPLGVPLPARLETMLSNRAAPGLATALALAAIRELWEETGLALAHPAGADPLHAALPADWQRFFDAGHRPALDRLDLIFRAITPLGRPRRFDARFFLVEATGITGDLDDFSGACDELSHLHWLGLDAARKLDLPFITEVVLGEVAMRLEDPAPRPAPFFHHAEGRSFIDAL
jgi:8-oxo-dGTP pyrophosphatase MutT (NUDIX family)